MGIELTATQKAWDEKFQLTPTLSMRPVDVKRLLGLEHAELPEILLFLNKCKQYGADPFMNDMYIIKYSATAKASIVTGVGFFQKKAAANPRFEGYGKTEWLTDKNGSPEWVDYWLPKIHGKNPLACRASCHIKGYRELQTFVVNWDENVKNTATWSAMPSRMLEKNAKVAMLREALPSDLGGLYISEEITGDEAPEVVNKVVTEPLVITEAQVTVVETPKEEVVLSEEDSLISEANSKNKIFLAKQEAAEMAAARREYVRKFAKERDLIKEQNEPHPTQEELEKEIGTELQAAPERSPDEGRADSPPGDWGEFMAENKNEEKEEIPF